MDPIHHRGVETVHEHGERWLCCKTCGAQWADHDPPELVTEGDGYCEEQICIEEKYERLGR